MAHEKVHVICENLCLEEGMTKQQINDKFATKVEKNNLQNQINGLSSGSPKGSYTSVSALTSANPPTGVYIVSANGHIYSWTKDGSNATDLGVYQATEVEEKSVEIIHLDEKIQDNFMIEFEKIPTANYTHVANKFCNVTTSNKLNIVDAQNYNYYSIPLEIGKIYKFNSYNYYQLRGLVIANASNDVVFTNPTGDIHSNGYFRCNENNLTAYISISNNAYGTRSINTNCLYTMKNVYEKNRVKNDLTLIDDLPGKFIQNDSFINNDDNAHAYIYKMEKGKHYYVRYVDIFNIAGLVIYNENFEKLYDTHGSGYVSSVQYHEYSFIAEQDGFIFVSKYQSYPLSISSYIPEEYNGNVLYGKKIVTCGDSFTEGDYSVYTDEQGLQGKNSPYFYDKQMNIWKTYPYWIAKRNKMDLLNEAKCGSDFTNITGASNPFSVTRYLNVPADADYILLQFGLNESDLTDEQIGTKNDTTNATLWGAYRVVFTHFMTNMPYAKIGVIISDAWLSLKYANALKEICEYWGVPYLDLKGDVSVPLGLWGRRAPAPAVCQTATDLRYNAFVCDRQTDSHPNIEAHKYRSTFIENFLRSL